MEPQQTREAWGALTPLGPDGRPQTQSQQQLMPPMMQLSPAGSQVSPVQRIVVQSQPAPAPAPAIRMYAVRGGALPPAPIYVQPAPTMGALVENPLASVFLPSSYAAAANGSPDIEPSPSPLPPTPLPERVRVRRSSLPNNVPSHAAPHAVHPAPASAARHGRPASTVAWQANDLPQFSARSTGSTILAALGPNAAEPAEVPRTTVKVAPRPTHLPALAANQDPNNTHHIANDGDDYDDADDDDESHSGNDQNARRTPQQVFATPARAHAASARAWPSLSRNDSETSGVRLPQRYDVRELGNHSALSTAREKLPTYSDQGAMVSMLAKLDPSVGTLVPRFDPAVFLYTLYVPRDTTSVRFFAEPIEGEVRINTKTKERPVKLETNTTNVLIMVFSKSSEFAQDGKYNVSIERVDSLDDLPAYHPPTAPHSQDFRVTKFKFETNDPSKLPLAEGDYVCVLGTTDNGWLYGHRCDVYGAALGEDGFFPPLFVAPAPHLPQPPNTVHVAPATIVTPAPAGTETLLTSPGASIGATADDGDELKQKKQHLQEVSVAGYSLFTILVSLATFIMLMAALSKGSVDSSANPLLGPRYSTLKSLGARWVADIKQGHIYLLFTEIFLPPGIIKFLLDLTLFWTALRGVERRCGFLRAAVIFILAGIIGNLTGAIFVPRWISAGSGSANFGCVGALAALWMHSPAAAASTGPVLLRRAERVIVAVVVLLSMLLGALPGVENWSHVGGLFAGYCSCLMVAGPIFIRNGCSRAAAARLSLVGLITTATLLLSNIINLAFFSDTNSPCDWCMKATCFHTRDFCDVSRLGAPALAYAL